MDRSHLIAANRTVLLQVVIDDTPDDEDNVPDRFREVQWTRIPDGDALPAFVDRVRALLAPTAGADDRGSRRAAAGNSGNRPEAPGASSLRKRRSILLAALAVALAAAEGTVWLARRDGRGKRVAAAFASGPSVRESERGS